MTPSGDAPCVVLLELGRTGALGALRRVETWDQLWTGTGATVHRLLLRRDYPATPRDVGRSLASCLRDRELAWETAAWSTRRVSRRLAQLSPDVVVCITARSFHPAAVPPGALVVLDYVDRLSDNYARRAELTSSAVLRTGMRLLGRRMRAVEQRPAGALVRTAAGHGDARALGAAWVPNVVELPPTSVRGAADTDVLFVGSLDYAPNVDALRRVAAVWPEVQHRRPGTSLVVAGARPDATVRDLARDHGWDLVPDFAELDDVCARARVAVAPVAVSTGLQNKVVETAARGLAQLVHPSVMAGLDPDFPAVVADDGSQLAQALVDLLTERDRCTALGELAREHVRDRYTAAAWTPWCRALMPDRHPRALRAERDRFVDLVYPGGPTGLR